MFDRSQSDLECKWFLTYRRCEGSFLPVQLHLRQLKLRLCMWLILMFMFVGMITPSTATAQATSSQLQKRLRSPIGDYSLSADTLLEALARIAAQFNLRMGIEWIGDTQHRRPIQLSLKNTTIDEVLRAALLSRAGYECSVQNDIVHIRPKAFL